jgi:fido (protein-threonine AMPylation protein)
MSDPYLDPQIGILRNKFRINDQTSLDRAEADAVALRSILLQANPLKDGGRVTRFTSPELIESELAAVFQNLVRDDFLKGLSRKDFAHKMGILFAEINRIHPFREGNGRAQRQFVRQLSNSVGYKLHFEVVSKERLVQASILSANGNVDMMVRLMDEITDTERIQPLAKVIDHLKRTISNGMTFTLRPLLQVSSTPVHSRAPMAAISSFEPNKTNCSSANSATLNKLQDRERRSTLQPDKLTHESVLS